MVRHPTHPPRIGTAERAGVSPRSLAVPIRQQLLDVVGAGAKARALRVIMCDVFRDMTARYGASKLGSITRSLPATTTDRHAWQSRRTPFPNVSTNRQLMTVWQKSERLSGVWR